ncbi:MAG: NAD(P)-binding domain-containing protein [Polyangiaceae bacterium]
MQACVIGAGASGLVASKALADQGVSYRCFEVSDRVGGLWVFKNPNQKSAAYRSLHINTSRERMQFRDYPMPRDFPDYPEHRLIARYLDDYAQRFDLLRHIEFETEVKNVTPHAAGGFRVALGSGEQAHFDAVVVANGHHWDPRLPEPRIPGEFSGLELHSHAYVDPDEPYALRGKRVAVVGIGNSAVDIASELGRARGDGQVFLSTRRGAWVLPKYVFGRPLDEVSGAGLSLLPRPLRQSLAELWYRLAVGDPRRFGLPLPDHRLGDAHPTVSNDLFGLLGAGALSVKPAITRFEGSTAHFADGSREQLDAVIYATGYRVTFPFFAPDFVSAPDNELPLYLRLFAPARPGIYFIGLCQPLGPIMPIAEAQAKLVAALLAGKYALPSEAEMQRAARLERASVRRRFGGSARHTMQVDFDEYLAELAEEQRRGAQRAPRTRAVARLRA